MAKKMIEFESNEKYLEIKSEAVKLNMKIGDFIVKLFEEYKKQN